MSEQFKKAEEWLNEIGEACGNDMFSPNSKLLPGYRTEQALKAVQLNSAKVALEMAAKMIHTDPFNANRSNIEAFATNLTIEQLEKGCEG